jgi:short-subunit dehydrogenase
MYLSPRQQQRFRNRYGPWAVVTGASSGIGLAIATALAEAGLHLVLVSRRRATLEHLATELKARYGIETRVIESDLGQTKAFETVESKHQRT